MRGQAFNLSLLASFLIHGVAIVLASILIRSTNLPRENFFPISLVEVPTKLSVPLQKIQAPPEMKKFPPPPSKAEKVKEAGQLAIASIAKPEPPVQGKHEPATVIETKPTAPVKTEPAPNFASGARVEGGGSEAGAGILYGAEDIAVVRGAGTGGGGTAGSGLGRGVPGLAAQQPVLRTHREAKPIQAARASYPPMALRMGLESDVTVKIEIDTEGKVTNAEIIKSGGAGFDEEALKAVKQSRFEPAQKDGQNVSAEFAYIYRFRLQR